jgi:hypothetical protein
VQLEKVRCKDHSSGREEAGMPFEPMHLTLQPETLLTAPTTHLASHKGQVTWCCRLFSAIVFSLSLRICLDPRRVKSWRSHQHLLTPQLHRNATAVMVMAEVNFWVLCSQSENKMSKEGKTHGKQTAQGLT